MKPIKRLLVIRMGALGDLVHLSATMDAIKHLYPELELHLLTRSAYAQLATMMPAVQHTWFWNPQAGWPALWHMGNTLREAGIDGVINLHPSFKTWLLTQCIQPSSGQAMYHKQKLKPKGQAQRPLSRRHAIADFYQPFQKLLALPEFSALPSERPIPRLQIPHNMANEPVATEHTQRPQKADRAVWVGLIPGVGGKRANRAWLLPNWVSLSRALLTKNPQVHILLFGGKDEEALAAELINILQVEMPSDSVLNWTTRIQNHCGRWDITGTAQWMQQCNLIAGGDTGPLHLAAGLGISTLGLFGPTSPLRTGARGVNALPTLLPPDAVDCWPCEQADCRFSDERNMACMRELSVETVEAEIWQALRF
jgi:ADP-heptose:LPS heptosyltransferase